MVGVNQNRKKHLEMKALRTFIYICMGAIVLITGFKIEVKLNEYRTAQEIHTERVMEVREGRKVDFEKLQKQNKDVRGWIYIPDTNIDYPIVQGEDNDYYLHRDFDHNYLYDGSIFIDASVEAPFSSEENTVIYGHRMASGAMFHDLCKYESKDFFDGHKVIVIETPERSYDLHVVAFCTELSDSKLYSTWFADEPSYADFGSDNDTESEGAGSTVMTKAQFIDFVRSHADVLSDDQFDETDIFVTLSTCALASGDKRNQVIGVLKDAEIEEKSINVKTEKPLLNKWLLMQVVVGAIMLIAVGSPFVTFIRHLSQSRKREVDI